VERWASRPGSLAALVTIVVELAVAVVYVFLRRGRAALGWVVVANVRRC
jgi:hypothetical protein